MYTTMLVSKAVKTYCDATIPSSINSRKEVLLRQLILNEQRSVRRSADSIPTSQQAINLLFFRNLSGYEI